MQTHNPSTEMATTAAVEADDQRELSAADDHDVEALTKTGDKSPSTVLGWVWVNASSDADGASEHFESSIHHESPFTSDSGSDVRSATIRQQLELRNDHPGSADTKIVSNSNSDAVSRCDADGSYVFEACMISVSCLLVLSSPLLLHRLYNETLALLRAIAIFISACIIFLILIFSPRMTLPTVLFHMPCPVLLAIAADRFVGPRGGFLVMHMATGWLAGMLGYAYGLQHVGRQTTAKHINPQALTEEDKRKFTEARGPAAATFGVLSLLMVTGGALPLWLFPEDALSVSVAFLFLMEWGAVLCWVAYVARFLLLDAFLSDRQIGYIVFCCIPNVVIGFLLLLLSCLYPTTDTIGVTFLWCSMLFIAGLLGYELSVHAQCNQMMLSRQELELRDGLSSAVGESPPTDATTSDD